MFVRNIRIAIKEDKIKMKKTVMIGVGVVCAAVICVAALFVGTNNRVVSLEEQINSSSSEIEVMEKRRVDLVYNLVDTLQSYNDYESGTLKEIVEARQQASKGDIKGAQTVINAVAEQYPELKSSENYKQFMTELSLTENQISQYRNSYNKQVKEYNKTVRSFPTNMILNIMGYTPIEVDYLEFEAPSDAPQDLFE